MHGITAHRPYRYALAGALGTALLVTACTDTASPPTGPTAPPSRGVDALVTGDDLLKSIRRSTARYHSTTQALAAGYLPTDQCVAAPPGGMGYHWLKPQLVDGAFSPSEPEALLYVTGPGGNLVLAGVEYIVLDEGQPRPTLGDRAFDEGGTPIPAPHWSLHVWLYETNPAGIFAPFNPDVGCP